MCKHWGISLSRFHLLIVAVGASATLCLGLASTAASVDPGEDLLRQRLEEARDRSVILVAGEPLCAMEHLRHFYQRRTYQPAWYRGADLLPQAHSLI